MIHPLAFIGEWNTVLIAIAGLLIFGKRLPDVGRSLGKGILEFKKGLSDVTEEIDNVGKAAAPTPSTTLVNRLPDQTAPKATIDAGYKFDPYTGKPIQAEPVVSGAKFDPYTGKPLGESDSGGVGA